MPRKLFKVKQIFAATFALLTLILIYILYHQNSNNYYDEFVVVRAIDTYNDDEISVSNLINFTNFQYKIKPDSLCNNFEDELLGIIIVTSYVGHDEVRSAHRQSLGQQKLRSMGLLRVFLLADIPSTDKFIKQKAIYDESDRFEDIVQGNFVEAYRNLTYKHVMGLRWAASECSVAKYIIKVDDDTVFDAFYLQTYLENLESTLDYANEHILAGYILDGKKPIRLQASKWYVTRQEFGDNIYPDYLSGWLYITNPRTARALVAESQVQSYFWIDDTWVTGVLRDKRNIPLTRLNKWFSANSQFLDCCVDDARKHSFKCDYHVGPNGGDVKLLTQRKCVRNVSSFYQVPEVHLILTLCFIDIEVLDLTIIWKTRTLYGASTKSSTSSLINNLWIEVPDSNELNIFKLPTILELSHTSRPFI